MFLSLLKTENYRQDTPEPVSYTHLDVYKRQGAGHAGCEAALACARMGLKTVVFTVSVDSIAMMPCNPNIGGSSKGHLVCELDALGGEMGKNIDKAFIQTKMLNVSKGPAVHSLRAQADKQEYVRQMRHTMENTPGLTIKQAEAAEIIVEAVKEGDKEIKRVTGVKTVSGALYHCKKAVLCTGVYLKAKCIYGETKMCIRDRLLSVTVLSAVELLKSILNL